MNHDRRFFILLLRYIMQQDINHRIKRNAAGSRFFAARSKKVVIFLHQNGNAPKKDVKKIKNTLLHRGGN